MNLSKKQQMERDQKHVPANAEQQQKVGMIDRMNELFSEAITTRLFPMEKVSCQWLTCATDALHYASPRGIDMSHQQFADLISAVEQCEVKLTLFQFACLSNNLEVTNANQLVLPLNEYKHIMLEGAAHVKEHQDIVTALRKEVEAQAMAEFQKPVADNAAPADSGGLKAVTAEA